MFLGIVLEAFPFILLGIIVSSILQNFVSDKFFKQYLPKNIYLAIVPAAVLGLFFPICECAIIPVVRGMIKKGLPVNIGIIVLITAPVINPITILSTYFAFGSSLDMVMWRVGITLLIAIIMSFIIKTIFNKKNILIDHDSKSCNDINIDVNTQPFKDKVKQSITHVNEEFLSTSKYILIGALIAGVVQTFLNRNVLSSFAEYEGLSVVMSMSFAYIVSICSSSDAFIAASFNSTFSFSAIIAFLVYGPVLDVKNLIVMLTYFKVKFVVVFSLIFTFLVFLISLLL